jgi:MT0933-like antitoxin protein
VSTPRRLRNSSRGGDPTISRDSPNRKLPTDKGRNMGFLDKAKDLLAQNADTVDSAIDKASEFVDSKTDGKFKDTVNQVQEAAKNALKDGTKDDK